MSEQQNVALVQKLFEAFGRGDVRTILDNCATDCVFHSPGPAIIPYAGVKTGHTGIRSYFEGLMTTQRNANLSITKYLAQGDTVVALGQYTAEVFATQKRIDTPVALTFEIRNGKVQQHMVLADTAAIATSYATYAAAAS